MGLNGGVSMQTSSEVAELEDLLLASLPRHPGARGRQGDEMSDLSLGFLIQQQPVPKQSFNFKGSACKTDYTILPERADYNEPTVDSVTFSQKPRGGDRIEEMSDKA